MPRIYQLPPHVIAKIAAGEVIERPASVVKELLENSIDAGSTRIEIDLEQGGMELIRVVDDGCGIEADDLHLAFAGHATSKLKSADDLFEIRSMGFRGEALSSIAGIAQVTLQSRPAHQPTGAELRCEGGEFSEVRPWNGAPGTRMEVRHLFYSVPVRKKFMKSIATEHGHVCEVVTRLALANPNLHIVLRHNGKLVYDIPATASLPDRITLFFGDELHGKLFPIESPPGPVQVTGYIADPSFDRGNAKLQYLFVNGRWFRDRSIAHALQEAYRGLLMTGRYCAGFLFLTVPTDQVDVNVHPTKAEVRFRDNSLLYSLVRSTVKARLMGENLIPRLEVPDDARDPLDPEPRFTIQERHLQPPERTSSPTPTLFSPRRDAAERTPSPWEEVIGNRPFPSRSPATTPVPAPTTAPADTPESADAVADVQVLSDESVDPSESDEVSKAGDAAVATASTTPTSEEPPPFDLSALPPGAALQVHDAYLVHETPEGMLVIDQHALHERILYEQLRRRVRDGKLEVQRLLIPEPMELPPDQAAAVLDASEELAELGLEVSDFGGNTILLSSYPTLLSRRPPHEILQGVIDWLVTKDRPPAKEALLDHLLATMACKAAVKAGDRLTPEEISYLLQLRQFAEDSHHCPHGRPTSLLFSRQELDRQFRRI